MSLSSPTSNAKRALSAIHSEWRRVFEDGMTDVIMDAIKVRIYSAERTLADCFETYSVPALRLSQGDRARVDASLIIGAASVTVEVGSVEPQLQTDSSVVGTVVNERQVEDLPLDGRNFMEIAQISGWHQRWPAQRAFERYASR
jgi:hypothetical protein